VQNSAQLIRNTLHLIKKEPLFLMRKKRALKYPFKKIPLAPVLNIAAPVVEKPAPAPKPETIKVKPEKKPAPPKVEKAPSIAVKLEKIEATLPEHSLSIKKHLLTVDPTLPLIDGVLEDHKAKERIKRGTCPYAIALLAFEKNNEKITFLKNIEKALGLELAPAKLYNASVIEKEDRWDSFLASKDLKLIIATDHEIFHAKNLMKLYKELPNQSKRMIKDVALFLLPDLNLYFKQPILKRSLYKALCHKIKTL
jgi:hypothetical protein